MLFITQNIARVARGVPEQEAKTDARDASFNTRHIAVVNSGQEISVSQQRTVCGTGANVRQAIRVDISGANNAVIIGKVNNCVMNFGSQKKE